ncbi:MAG: hypothetical protein IIT74_03855, partial [Bacteroidales bacterium]|nr:hypothetical protein [Bacteroidales bacterium]
TGSTLEEKLTAIETALQSQTTDLGAKLALVETAVQSETTGLETKLGLVEAAVTTGLADVKTAQDLVKEAIEATGSTLEEKLTAIETALQSQTTDLGAKLALVETAVKEGFADANAQQELLQQAVESLGGTMEEKLAALEEAMKSQTSSIETKLDAIETAVENGLADAKEQRALIQKAVESLAGTETEKLAKIEQAITSQTTTLSSKLAAIEAAFADGASDKDAALEAIKTAIETSGTTTAEKLAALEQAISDQTTDLTTKLEAIETAVTGGVTDVTAALALIKTAVEAIPASLTSLDTDLSAKIAEVVTAIGAVNTTLTTGDVATALSNILDAITDQTDYSEILTLIQENVAAIGPSHGSPKDLTVWCYPNATFDLDLSKAVEVSDIFCALHASKDGSYTADNIETVEFLPLNDSIAPVQVTFDRERHFLRFHPDTTGSRVWRNFQDSSGSKNEGVTGKLILTDRWKQKDTIFNMVTPRGEKLFKISWFNASGFSWRKKVSMSMIDDNKVTLVLNEFSRVLGFDYDKLKSTWYSINSACEKYGNYKRITGKFKPEETALEVEFADDYHVGDSFGLIGTIVVYITPSETEPSFKPCQMLFRFDLTVEITNN